MEVQVGPVGVSGLIGFGWEAPRQGRESGIWSRLKLRQLVGCLSARSWLSGLQREPSWGPG
jgi:hypothetical protein